MEMIYSELDYGVLNDGSPCADAEGGTACRGAIGCHLAHECGFNCICGSFCLINRFCGIDLSICFGCPLT